MNVLIVILGLSIGSFFNVVVSRLDRKEGMATDRSRCPHCNRVIAWYDLIPVLSFLLLRGRCRMCGKGIAWRYPVVEITTALCAILIWNHYGFSDIPTLVYVSLVTGGLILLFFFDLEYLILPDRILFPLIIITFAFQATLTKGQLIPGLINGCILGGLFAILYVVSRGRWVGFGDVKLIFFIGILFGYPIGFAVVVLSIWIAALGGLVLILLGRATAKTALPFGSFLTAVAIGGLLFQYELQLFLQQFPAFR